MTLPKIIIESKDDDAFCGIILDEKDFNNGITLKVELTPDLTEELKIPLGTVKSRIRLASSKMRHLVEVN